MNCPNLIIDLMISIHNILLEPDVNTTTIYTSSNNKLGDSIIDKLEGIDVVNTSEDTNNNSGVQEMTNSNGERDKGRIVREEIVKCNYFIEENLRTEIEDISHQYSIICFENIKLKQQLELQN